ncbi:MAG: hypothetical protein SGPRY_012901, partial [Prymnesium sp.]
PEPRVPPMRPHSRTLLLPLLLSRARCFVLNPGNLSLSGGLPGSAYRWTVPSSLESSEGLGKGLAYALDPSFCDQMIPLFPENEGMYGFITFVDCKQLKAAIGRAMSTWSANHQLISFTDITDSPTCGNSISGALDDPCPWEVLITSASGEVNSNLAAFVINSRQESLPPYSWLAAGLVVIEAYAPPHLTHERKT